MKEEDFKPDIEAHEFDVFATDAQKEMREKLRRYGWVLTHMWEYEQGQLAAWFCAVRPGGKRPGWSHCYILPSGEMKRYENRIRIGVADPYSDSEGNIE